MTISVVRALALMVVGSTGPTLYAGRTEQRMVGAWREPQGDKHLESAMRDEKPRRGSASILPVFKVQPKTSGVTNPQYSRLEGPRYEPRGKTARIGDSGYASGTNSGAACNQGADGKPGTQYGTPAEFWEGKVEGTGRSENSEDFTTV